VDILAHPGLISEEDVNLAREKGVFLEITSRQGHCLTNGHVARLAQKAGTPLILNTDTHLPEDLIAREKALKVALGAGLGSNDFERMLENSWQILSRRG
jgi:histidinol phosphatase-like PHP family hydrolase